MKFKRCTYPDASRLIFYSEFKLAQRSLGFGTQSKQHNLTFVPLTDLIGKLIYFINKAVDKPRCRFCLISIIPSRSSSD